MTGPASPRRFATTQGRSDPHSGLCPRGSRVTPHPCGGLHRPASEIFLARGSRRAGMRLFGGARAGAGVQRSFFKARLHACAAIFRPAAPRGVPAAVEVPGVRGHRPPLSGMGLVGLCGCWVIGRLITTAMLSRRSHHFGALIVSACAVELEPGRVFTYWERRGC